MRIPSQGILTTTGAYKFKLKKKGKKKSRKRRISSFSSRSIRHFRETVAEVETGTTWEPIISQKQRQHTKRNGREKEDTRPNTD